MDNIIWILYTKIFSCSFFYVYIFFCFRTISNNDELWNNEITSNSDNMQLANPEPRQVNMCDGSSSVSPNFLNNVMQKYGVA